LSGFYQSFPEVNYVTISDFQRLLETMPKIRTIHHGINFDLYQFQPRKQPYFSFLGRIAPIKGTHLAIQVARETGIPLKIAGEVQPIFRGYFETDVEPYIDGDFIEYVGEADLTAKNELLGNSLAMLFPIQWDEPFGLVMIKAMACGTPVLAMRGGSVSEVVKDGISGYVCNSVNEMIERTKTLDIAPETVWSYGKQKFSLDCMVDRYVSLYQEIISGHSTAALSAASDRSEPDRAIA
jgi:glycosyltransferase involved in cell wall biosynthesis